MSSYHRTCSKLSISDVVSDFGKSLCKEKKISPDAVMQMAFQVNIKNIIGLDL